ncbi:MAG: RDD family protein [Elusimicrobiaceae bacterium]|nr:RDD family protein [Elusimicrobiaceae bacterium]
MTNNNPYAGFWKRFAAFFIDIIILYVFIGILKACFEPAVMENIIEKANRTATLPLTAIIIYTLIFFILSALYFILWESSSKQATWGKQIIRIKVVDAQGKRLSFGRATSRTLSKILSSIFYIGFIMAGITQQKQALHDKIANTYVVDKDYTSDNPLPLLPKHTGCMISLFTIGGLLIILVLLVILSGKVHFSGRTNNPDKDFHQALNRLYHLHAAAQGHHVQQNSGSVRIIVGGASKYGIFQTGDYLFMNKGKDVRMMLVGHPELAFRVMDNTDQICCEPHQPNACDIVHGLSICTTD